MTAYINKHRDILDLYLNLPFISSKEDSLYIKLESRLNNGLVAVNIIEKVVARIDVTDNILPTERNIDFSITLKPGNKSHFADEYMIVGKMTIRFIPISILNKIIRLDSTKIKRGGRIVSQVVLFKLSNELLSALTITEQNNMINEIREDLRTNYNINM